MTVKTYVNVGLRFALKLYMPCHEIIGILLKLSLIKFPLFYYIPDMSYGWEMYLFDVDNE